MRNSGQPGVIPVRPTVRNPGRLHSPVIRSHLGRSSSGASLESRRETPSIIEDRTPHRSAGKQSTGLIPDTSHGEHGHATRLVNVPHRLGGRLLAGLPLRARGGRAGDRGRGGRRHLQAAGQRGRPPLVLRCAAARPPGRSRLRRRDGDRRGRASALQHPLAALSQGCRGLGPGAARGGLPRAGAVPAGIPRTGQAAALGEPLHRAPGHPVRAVRPAPAPRRRPAPRSGADRPASPMGGDAALHRPLLPGARRRPRAGTCSR